MNAAQLVEQVAQCGGRLWLEGETIKAQLPKNIGDTLAPQLRQRKAEIIDLLRASNQRAKPSQRPAVTIWHFTIDGKRVTAIDYEHRIYSAMLADMQSKFGAARVTNLEHHKQ